MRKITAEGFGNKERAWNAKVNIYQWREQWQHHTNQALKQAGLDCQIDGRSHAKKGLDKEPKLHLGVHATALERKGIQTELGNENRAIEARNNKRAKLRYQLDEINEELDKLLLEKNEQTLSSTVDIYDNKQTTLIEEQEIKEHNQHPVTEPINEIQLPDNNNLNAEKNTSVDTQQTKTYLSNKVGKQQETIECLSLEERKESLEQKAEAFKEQQEKLKLQIENSADEKTQDRLRLKAKLDDSNFTVAYNNELVAILTEQDNKKNANAINELKYQIIKSERTYKKQVAEWSVCAVRDDDYDPLDEKSALKIEKIKAIEQKIWTRFEDKAISNDWSLDKIAREKQRLIEELDINLKHEFGLELDYGLEL